MPSNTDVASRFDLIARTIDLTNVLLKATKGPGSSALLLEIVHWLGRERLSSERLAGFIIKASTLVYPNEAGQMLLDNMRRGGEERLTAHLSLRQSGSLGRLLVADPSMCWVPSTVACLYQCHSDDEFVADAICECILQDGNAFKNVVDRRFHANYLERLQLKAVVEKVVSSVWFNVVNSGQQLHSLPCELIDICPSGHYMDSQQLGKVIRSLQYDHPKIIVNSKYLFRNIAVWLHYHFAGLLRVMVSSKIIYSKQLGHSPQEIELRVEAFCSESCVQSSTSSSTYEILAEIDGGIRRVLEQKTDYPGTWDAMPTSRARQPLYYIQENTPMEVSDRTKGLEIIIKTTARKMMEWLLNISLVERIDGVRGLAELGFWAKLEPISDEFSYTIASILKATPKMSNLPWGQPSRHPVIYSAPTDDRYGTEPGPIDISAYYSRSPETQELTLEDVLRYFPILQDMLKQDVAPLQVQGVLEHKNITQSTQEGMFMLYRYNRGFNTPRPRHCRCLRLP